MATLTKQTLRERVADELRISQLGVTLSAEDADKIDKSIDDTHAELRQRGLCWWTDSAIPDDVAYAMTVFVAARAAAKFGKAGQGYEIGETRGAKLIAGLKSPATMAPMRPRYF